MAWIVLLLVSLAYAFNYGIELTKIIRNSPTPQKPIEVVTIGSYNWPGYYPIAVAYELGLFKKYGANVKLERAKTLTELNDWFRTGHTQVTSGVLADFVALSDLGTPMKMLMAIDYSISDAILAKTSIKTSKDLVGKRIGLSELNSFGEYFLIRALRELGISPKSVKLYTIEPSRVPEAILNGEIDAGHTWDPALTRGIRSGLRIIFSSADLHLNPIVDGVAFRDEVLDNQKLALAIVRAIFESMEMQKTDPKQFARVAAKFYGIPPEEVAGYLEKDVRFTDLKENIRLFTETTLKDEVAAIAELFADRGSGTTSDEDKSVIDDRIIRLLEQEQKKNRPGASL